MVDDRRFLHAILASPEDESPRLVYADWLEEHGDAKRAEFLRVDLELAKLSKEDTGYRKLRSRWRGLRAQIPPTWLSAVARQPIENCAVRFEFECPKKWDKLRTTEDDGVRFCDACEQNVYYCRDIDKAREHAWQGHCVAVDAGVTRSPGDLDPPIRMTLGVIAVRDTTDAEDAPGYEYAPDSRDQRGRSRRTSGKIRPRGSESADQE
jgi:uncharacterized protein (TIGR02996 family)